MRAKLADRGFERRVKRLTERARPVGTTSQVASKLISLRRFEEADTVLQVGLSAYPNDASLLFPYALSAHNSGRYAEALARWERVRRVRQDEAMIWCGIAANARMVEQLNYAEATIMEARGRFPEDYVVISEAARVFDAVEKYREALALWEMMIRHPPVHVSWLRAYADDLMRLERFAEAEAEYERIISNYPDDPHRAFVQGQLAMARHDWDGALVALSTHVAQYPDFPPSADMRNRAIMLSRLERETTGSLLAFDNLPALVDVVEDDAARALLLGFESIGEDCEFGLVQRHYGAEPLGLLRWNTVGLGLLMDALAHRFEDMGDPTNTELVTAWRGEYLVFDKRWDLGMHTWLFNSEVSASTLFPKMCRRVVYLRDKFLGDLQSAEKIFVYKSDTVSVEDLEALHDILKSYGPARLLNVKAAKSDAPAPLNGGGGQVVKVRCDLFVGFLSHMGNADGYWDILYEEWVAICQAVKCAA